MTFLFLVFAILFISSCNAAAVATPRSTEQLIRQIRESAPREPPGLELQSLLAAAELLRPTEPSAANGFIRDCLALLESAKSIEAQVTTKVLEAGMQMDPAEVLQSIRFIPDQRAVDNALIGYYLKQRCPKKAIALVDQCRREGLTGLSGAILILGQLIQQQPNEGIGFFNEMLSSAPSTLNPEQALFLLRAVREVVLINPPLARRAIFRVAVSTQSGEFSRAFPGTLTAKYRIGGRDVWTRDIRESVLLPALAYLHVLAPNKYAEFAAGSEHKELLNAVTWETLLKSTQPLQIVWLKADSKPVPKAEIVALAGDLSPRGSASLLPVEAQKTATERPLDDLFEKLSQGETSDRAWRAIERQALQEIRRMPADRERVGTAAELLSLAGGQESAATLEPITGFLLDSLRPLASGTLPSSVGDPGDVWCASMYSFVASQIHQHRMTGPENDPSLRTRLALIDLRDRLQEAYDFRLKDTKAHQYTLRQFRGHMVLLQFWSRQCGTCVRSLPGLEKIYRENARKNVVVLAIRDEQAPCTGSLPETQGYTFPLLSDDDGAVSGYFGISVVPTTVAIDQTGRIAGSIVGDTSSDQLRQMIARANRRQGK